MPALSYRPKSQTLRFGAWLIWVLVLIAIHFEFGWELRAEGPPLAILATLALMVFLTSGVTLSVDRVQDLVRTRRRLIGLPIWSATRRVALEAVELRAAWMGRSRGGRSVVYDLVAVGRDQGLNASAEPVELALKEDLIRFRLAEGQAREAARAFDLPLVMRWDAVLDAEPAERREPDELARPLGIPDALGHWWTWI